LNIPARILFKTVSLRVNLRTVLFEALLTQPDKQVTGGEKLAPVTPQKLMGLWTIASGNLDSAVNGELDSGGFLAPEFPETRNLATSPTMTKQTDMKAEANIEVDRSREAVEEYLEAESQKAEAHAKEIHVKFRSSKIL
jgi:hypothetical protein